MPVSSAYIASDAALKLIDQVGGKSAITMLGIDRSDMPGAQFIGPYDQPDYSALLLGDCDLAVVPVDIMDAGYAAIRDRLSILDIPVFVDASAKEATELGKLEWIKLYGMLFGCEAQAEKIFAAAETAA